MGSPVSCSGLFSPSVHDCNEDYPSFWWDWFRAFAVGSPVLGQGCVLQPASVPTAIPPPGGIGPGPSRGVTLLWDKCTWGLPTFARNVGFPYASPVYSFGLRSPFGSRVSFRHSCSRTKVYIGSCSFTVWPSFRVEWSYSYALHRIVGTSCCWWLSWSHLLLR